VHRRALCRPGGYPATDREEIRVTQDGATSGLDAAVHETHIGLVVLAGDRAYKVKKAVRTPFLDFGTPQQRLAALQRELELNRRLSRTSTHW
jgi:aminoglycoside phosphotransferase family enzyme